MSDRNNRHTCEEGRQCLYHCSHKFTLPHRAQCLTGTTDTHRCLYRCNHMFILPHRAQHPKGPAESDTFVRKGDNVCTTVTICLSYHTELSVWQVTGTTESNRHICEDARRLYHWNHVFIIPMHMYTYRYSILCMYTYAATCLHNYAVSNASTHMYM